MEKLLDMTWRWCAYNDTDGEKVYPVREVQIGAIPHLVLAGPAEVGQDGIKAILDVGDLSDAAGRAIAAVPELVEMLDQIRRGEKPDPNDAEKLYRRINDYLPHLDDWNRYPGVSYARWTRSLLGSRTYRLMPVYGGEVNEKASPAPHAFRLQVHPGAYGLHHYGSPGWRTLAHGAPAQLLALADDDHERARLSLYCVNEDARPAGVEIPEGLHFYPPPAGHAWEGLRPAEAEGEGAPCPRCAQTRRDPHFEALCRLCSGYGLVIYQRPAAVQ